MSKHRLIATDANKGQITTLTEEISKLTFPALVFRQSEYNEMHTDFNKRHKVSPQTLTQLQYHLS